MERYTIGRMIEQGQIDFGVSNRELYEGVLTARKLEQIKNSDEFGDRMIWDFLIERLGVCPEHLYKCYVSDEEMKLGMLRLEIIGEVKKIKENIHKNANTQKSRSDLINCELLVENYRKKWKETNASVMGSAKVHELFCDVMEIWILLEKLKETIHCDNCNTVTYNGYDKLNRYILTTWNALHLVPIEDWIKGESSALSLLEVELMILYAHVLEGMRQRQKAKEILEWICIPYMSSTYRKRNRAHLKLLPYVINELIEFERKDNNDNKANELICRLEMLKKYGINEYGGIGRESTVWDNDAINVDFYIKKCRQEKNISQQSLAENIMEPENYSRYESGKIRVRWKKKAELLEKLGENSLRVQLFVDSEHPKVVSAAVRIADNLNVKNYYASAEEYIEVKCWLKEDTETNKKFIEMVEKKLY